MTSEELQALEKRVHAIVRPERELLWLYILTSLLGFIAAPLIFVPLFFHYETLWYRFSASGIAMGSGILFRSEQQLTYARMQDIHLSQNIVERWLGIGTVTVQTAGAGAGGNLRIVGVRDFNGIRDYLYAKMRGVRDESHGTSTDALLTDIRDALRDAANALAKKEA